MANFVPVDEFDLVIFGGTGDLALRKLLPALYHRVGDEQITGDSRIIAASRGDVARDAYLEQVEQALRSNLPDGEFRDEQWSKFRDRIHYVQCDAHAPDQWQSLVDLLVQPLCEIVRIVDIQITKRGFPQAYQTSLEVRQHGLTCIPKLFCHFLVERNVHGGVERLIAIECGRFM